MIEELLKSKPAGMPSLDTLVIEPFLHFGPDRIYNTLTDQFLSAADSGFTELQSLSAVSLRTTDLHPSLANTLFVSGWLVETTPDLSTRFRLKYVSLEASTVCNQGCYFCPVSVDRREDREMSMEFYEQVASQLSAHRATIDGVSMIQYNEPTADRRFLDQIRILKRYGLEPAVFTNATGLTRDRVDAILELGGARYISVNLSTLDRERYNKDREGDHLPLVLRNLDYLKDKSFATQMDIAVIGRGDEQHRKDFDEIRERFAGSRFNVLLYEAMDRAGAMPIGLSPVSGTKKLRGCEQTGSRPIQWAHINPWGQVVLCCQDYHNKYVVGDLHEQTLDEILSGPKMALFRRWAYGIENAPDNFICRRCIYALTE